jgi:hypothetical protein
MFSGLQTETRNQDISFFSLGFKGLEIILWLAFLRARYGTNQSLNLDGESAGGAECDRL